MLERLSPSVNAVAGGPVQMSVILNWGAANHVASAEMAPGAKVEESEGSKRGECYTTANGEHIHNRG